MYSELCTAVPATSIFTVDHELQNINKITAHSCNTQLKFKLYNNYINNIY